MEDSQHGQTHAETVFLAGFFTSLKEKCGKRKLADVLGTAGSHSAAKAEMMAINFPSPAINDNKMTSGSAGAISDPKSPACILASFNDGFDTLFHYWKLPYLQVAAIFQTCDIATLRLKISEIFFQCNQWCSPLTLKRYDRYPKQ